MKFSETWVREWVNPKLTTEQLAEQLTMAGLEVEGIDPVAGTFNNVVIGLVVECAQHPNADKLRITKVDIGGEGLLDIVCGAGNCRQGLKVACATVGAILPNNFKIKATRLRGEVSEGMLCSYDELGIAIEQEGIIELPESAPVGMDLRDYLRLNDHTIELSVTPNRADCLGILGIAREVAALNQLPVQKPDISPVAATVQRQISIQVDAPQACPRYLGRVIQGVNIHTKTPLWMREKLRRCGIRAIDVVVDITNYVLLELGQPMHAFDLSCIDNGIIIRMAHENEKLTLLDGQEMRLRQDTLVIADQSKALAIAGVFGGIYSGINDKTEEILLECAYFDPRLITGKARSYGLRTDASHRYERGVDPALQHHAIERATRLLLDICGGEAGPVIDISTESELPQKTAITLRRLKLDKLLGHVIADHQVTQFLTLLGCTVISDTATSDTTADEKSAFWQVIPPSWRFDIALEEDLIEEVARIYGYNNLPDTPLTLATEITANKESALPLQRVRELLIDRGFQEVITYSFVDPKTQQLLHPQQPALMLPNPVSSDMSVMRLSLWSGLISTVIYNQNRQHTRIRLFESGLCFLPDETAPLGVRQELMLAGIITGTRHQEQWDLTDQSIDFYDLKGEVELIMQLTGQQQLFSFQAKEYPTLHPGQSAAIFLQDEEIGAIGTLHPDIEKRLDLNGRTIVFQLRCQPLLHCMVPQAQAISRFPTNRRDIAIVVTENIPAEDILSACRKVGTNQLVDVNLFDVYRGNGIADGYKSLAISLILQDKNRTLAEDEIAATVAECVAVLQKQFQASLRD